MNIHRYILETFKGMNTRYHCPSCNDREKTFTRYIDTETRKYLDPIVGRCNRESKCGYHYTPRQYFQDHDISIDTNRSSQAESNQLVHKPTSYIPINLMEASMKRYEDNNLAIFLNSLFGKDVTAGVLKKYLVGTSKHWPGSTLFWQMDSQGNVRTGKIILYNPYTGHRVKEPFSHISWVHCKMDDSDFNLEQCLFGEHLLKESILPIAIVESEKTAIIASIYLPQFTWLATGGLQNLTAKKCQVLKGHMVVLFPDLNAYDKWEHRANEISSLIPGIRFEVSDLLEKNASDQERANGYDIADYLIKRPLKIKTEADKNLDLFKQKNLSLAKLIEVFDLSIVTPELNSKI